MSHTCHTALPSCLALPVFYPTLPSRQLLCIPLPCRPSPILFRFLVPQMSHANPLTPVAPPPLDQYASSVSSADLSLPPRPDSPRLLSADPSAIAHARLRQLAVWGAAAEDHRDAQHAEIDSFPSTLCAAPFPDRVPDTSLPRRSSLFSGSAGVTSRRLSRAPSLWMRNRNSSTTTCTGFNTCSSASATAPPPCGLSRARGSFLRRSSFHRYTRVTGNSQSASTNATAARPHTEGMHSDSDFDDLVHGLHATKVTETTLRDTL